MMQTDRYLPNFEVRELENVIERALILSSGPELRLAERSGVAPPPAPSDRIDAIDRLHIARVLDRCGGRGNAAERLGLHANTLRSRMKKKLGLVRARPLGGS